MHMYSAVFRLIGQLIAVGEARPALPFALPGAGARSLAHHAPSPRAIGPGAAIAANCGLRDE
jgi:hypothetical protein